MINGLTSGCVTLVSDFIILSSFRTLHEFKSSSAKNLRDTGGEFDVISSALIGKGVEVM
jgi:hypothetical protein